MPLIPGTRLSAYEILAPIGAGGMGEVYKARDSRLDRTVAVKILPSHVASDPTLRLRFEREAKALAAISHPHICSVYDVGQAITDQGTVDYLVMEHLEGETLAARLLRGSLPIADALRYGIQIADALDKAHRKGVIHRDLKPGNIILTASGAKLLDFGLAKVSTRVHGTDVTRTATVTSPLTDAGTIVGTFQYMSPEQLEGQEADARSDIFAFGAVLYEMVTGRKAFEGKSQASLIGAILKDEPPPPSSIQPTSPAVLDQLIRTCLAKAPDNRWQSAGDIGRQLAWIREGGSQASAAAIPTVASARARPAWLVPVTAAAIAAIVVGMIVWTLARPAPFTPAQVSRLLLAPSPNAPLVSDGGLDVAISPDGTRIVYVGETPQGGRGLYVRELGGSEPTLIQGTEAPSDFGNMNPSFSWDGKSVVFRISGKGIMRLAVAGGPAQKVFDDEAGYLGAASGPDDNLVVALFRGGRQNGLYRIPASGAVTLERLTPEGDQNVLYAAPTFLPNGKGVLFYLIGLGQPQTEQLAVLDLATSQQRILVDGGANPMYSTSGHLVFARGTTLMAVPFDQERLEFRGTPLAVQAGVRHPNPSTATDYGLSRNGTLIYVPSSDSDPVAARRIVWVDRNGRVVGAPVGNEIGSYRGLQISPDGQRVVVSSNGVVTVLDLKGRPPLPLVSAAPMPAWGPMWSLDQKKVFFAWNRSAATTWLLHSIPSDGSSLDPEPFPFPNQKALATFVLPLAWTPDGRLVVAFSVATGSVGDIMALSPAGGEVQDLVKTQFVEDSAQISPDGRWLAYRSNRSGRFEVWVQALSGGAPVRISQSGGRQPVWSRNGRELFYVEATRMMAVSVKSGEDFSFDAPVALFEWPFVQDFLEFRNYDVAADGRFLMLAPVRDESTSAASAPTGIWVVQNWVEELKRLVPVD